MESQLKPWVEVVQVQADTWQEPSKNTKHQKQNPDNPTAPTPNLNQNRVQWCIWATVPLNHMVADFLPILLSTLAGQRTTFQAVKLCKLAR